MKCTATQNSLFLKPPIILSFNTIGFSDNTHHFYLLVKKNWKQEKIWFPVTWFAGGCQWQDYLLVSHFALHVGLSFRNFQLLQKKTHEVQYHLLVFTHPPFNQYRFHYRKDLSCWQFNLGNNNNKAAATQSQDKNLTPSQPYKLGSTRCL